MKMKGRTAAGLLAGAAILVAVVLYAGAGAIVRALEGLGLAGLLLIVLAHLPIEALMGLSWRLAAGASPPASRGRFIWARLLRDAAAETLPFSQIGGFVLGVRALRSSGVDALKAVLSMSVDLVIELCAKLPYVLAGLLALFALAPASDLLKPMEIGLGVTLGAVAAALLIGRRAGATFETLVRRAAARLPVLASLRELHLKGDIEIVLRDIVRPRGRLWGALALHTLCWFLGAAELWLVFALLGRPVGALDALVIDSVVAGLRTFVFMVPAAAGVQEASYVLACAVFGIPPAVAVAASLARRARDLALGVATFGIAFGAEGRLRTLLKRGSRTRASTDKARCAAHGQPAAHSARSVEQDRRSGRHGALAGAACLNGAAETAAAAGDPESGS